MSPAGLPSDRACGPEECLRALEHMDKKHRISVLIPTLRASHRLPRLWALLMEQTLPPSEVIVIDSESEDGTADVARSLGCKVQKIRRESFDHGGTRNMAAQMASGDVLLFMTDDAEPADRNFVHNLTRRLGTNGTVAAYARQVPRSDALPTEALWRTQNYPAIPELKGRCASGSRELGDYRFSNVASAVLKSAFEAVGGFPARIIMSEDMVLCERLLQRGFTVAYQPDAIVVHSHNLTLAKLGRRYFDQGIFMKTHRGPLAQTKITREGAALVLKQVMALLKSGHVRYVPRSVTEALVRVCSYKLGRSYSLLPGSVVRRLSGNKAYWV